MIYFVFLAMFLIFQKCLARSTPICNDVQYSGDINSEIGYSFQVKISNGEDSTAFPNKIVVSNLSIKSTFNLAVNSSLFFKFGEIDNFIECKFSDADKTTCTTLFPNGEFRPTFALSNGTDKIQFSDINKLYVFHHAGFADGKDGSIFTPDNKCRRRFDTPVSPFAHTACCNTFETSYIFDDRVDTCVKFRDDVIIEFDEDATTHLRFSTFLTLNWVNNTILMEYSELPNIYNWSHEFGINSKLACMGTKNCSSIYQSISGEGDWEYGLFVSYKNTRLQNILIGHILMSDGITMRNLQADYTTKAPCWSRFAPIPFLNATVAATFCCTEFLHSGPLYPTATSTTPTTTPLLLSSTMPQFSNVTAKTTKNTIINTTVTAATQISTASTISSNPKSPFTITTNSASQSSWDTDCYFRSIYFLLFVLQVLLNK